MNGTIDAIPDTDGGSDESDGTQTPEFIVQKNKKRRIQSPLIFSIDGDSQETELEVFEDEYDSSFEPSDKPTITSITDLIAKQRASISKSYQDNTEPVDNTRKSIKSYITDSGMIRSFWDGNKQTKPRIRPGFRLFKLIDQIRNGNFTLEQVVTEYEIYLRGRFGEDVKAAVEFFEKCIDIALSSKMYYTYLYKKQKAKNNETVDYSTWYIDKTDIESVTNNVLYPYFEKTEKRYEIDFGKYINNDNIVDDFLF
jgi:hypothetical protein